MRLTALLLALPLAAAAHAPGITPARRAHARSFPSLPARAGARFNVTTAIPNDATTATDSATSAVASVSASAADDTATDSASVTSASAVASSAASSAAQSSAQSSSVDAITESVTSTSASSTLEVLPSTSSIISTTSTSSAADIVTVPSTSMTPSTTSTTDTPTSTSTTAVSTTVVTRTSSSSVTTVRSTVAAASSSAAKSSSSGGVGKTALIAIITVASVVGLAAAGWTIFRKWKLRPSNRFDERMRPIDFSPHGDGGHDDFLEKTLQRTASNASADRQRQQLVAELDSSLTAGVPDHDFTASAGVGAGVGAGAGAYGYSDGYDYHQQPYDYQPQGYEAGGYPPAAGDANYHYDYPTQDDAGYAHDAAHQAHSAHGHSAHGHEQQLMPDAHDYQHGYDGGYDQQAYGAGAAHAQAPAADGYAEVRRDGGGDNNYIAETFPASDFELGRPTGGAEGPYAQAATYRGY